MDPIHLKKINRRSFLHTTVLGAGALGVAGKINLSLHAKEKPPAKPIRLGIIGVGPRGSWLLTILLDQHPDVTISAICDIDKARLAKAIALVKEKRGNTPAGYSQDQYDYRNLCQRDDLEAVLIATPVNWLAPMAIDAMKSGKHAAMEVTGPQTEEECWELVKTKEKTGKRVMLLENCSYGDDNLMIYKMVHQGVFGEPYYAEGSYLHDCRSLLFDAKGKLTWRGELQRDIYGNNYPQHGLGSCCKWLGINDGDRLVWCQTAMTAPRETHLGAVAQFGADSEAVRIAFKEGDFTTSLIGTARGRLIRLDNSLSNTRPYSRYYQPV
ncbi:MAG TPA: Gfo/Idh/MocA family oxidoreductase [Verrucomicrobiae bacterium]|nr:Gfo/Idh/MocA family oxidoreductase [Verrucomicrobiae bacterium]